VTERADLRVLIVDDDPALARLLHRLVDAQGYPAPVQASSIAGAIPAAASADIVLLDHQLPDGSGIDVIDAIRAQPTHPSVIMITAHGSESLAAAALRKGADDYLVKDGSLPELLPQVMERVRRDRALRAALAAAEQELVRAERLAAIGELTVTLHHEINNPLMSAMAEVDLLLTGPEALSTEQQESLDGIRRSLGRIRDIVKRTREIRSAASTDYLDGVRMLDLDASAHGEHPVATRGIAAVYLGDESLSRVTGLLLGHAGYRVERCRTGAEVATRTRDVNTTLVVIGAGPGAAAEATPALAPPGQRTFRLIVLAADGAGAIPGADRVLRLPYDPTTFIQDVLAD
jgi:DNA-binding response OmpR family regulator